MADFPSQRDLFGIARDTIIGISKKITKAVIERDGSDANAITAAIAAVGDECIAQITAVAAGQFLDSARGQKLDRLVFDRFGGMVRKSAAPALVDVEFSTTTPTLGAFAIPQGTRVGTSDGREFIVYDGVNFPMGSTGPITASCRSVLAGAEQQVKIGAINSIKDSLAGAPADLVVTNTVASVGASDEESDNDLRSRARDFFVSARRGTLAAVRFGALTVEGVKSASVFEGSDEAGLPARFVDLIIADTFTDVLASQDEDPPTYQTQSALLVNEVESALTEYRPAGMYVSVRVASVVIVGVTMILKFKAGVDVDAVATTAKAKILAKINELAPGQDLVVSELYAVLRAIQGLRVTGDEIISPAGDIEASKLQVLRALPATINIVHSGTVYR